MRGLIYFLSDVSTDLAVSRTVFSKEIDFQLNVRIVSLISAFMVLPIKGSSITFVKRFH